MKGLKKEYLVLFTMAWNIYIEALGVGKLKSLQQRRNDYCVDLIASMLLPSHFLHGLLLEQN